VFGLRNVPLLPANASICQYIYIFWLFIKLFQPHDNALESDDDEDEILLPPTPMLRCRATRIPAIVPTCSPLVASTMMPKKLEECKSLILMEGHVNTWGRSMDDAVVQYSYCSPNRWSLVGSYRCWLFVNFL
jgi:hypothetical protein